MDDILMRHCSPAILGGVALCIGRGERCLADAAQYIDGDSDAQRKLVSMI
jgi:hypothetical protein